jgi:hypothetical protein
MCNLLVAELFGERQFHLQQAGATEIHIARPCLVFAAFTDPYSGPAMNLQGANDAQ